MKLDKPGVYFARDGRVALSYERPNHKGLAFCIREPETDNDVNFYYPGEDDEWLEGDWLPATPPEFPKLPPKTAMVYARTVHHRPDWWMVREGKFAATFDERFKDTHTADFKYLIVVPHPDNDPEAVRLIEEAKRTRVPVIGCSCT